jgi:glycosyltransferase involved in cell wall biosynthesis
MKIWGNAWHQQSAGQYYRVRVPLAAMQKLGLADAFVDDPFQDAASRQDRLFTSDIQLHYLVAGKAIHHQTQTIQALKPLPNLFGHIQHPPAMVFDMDDDIEMISPLNPKFATLGTRDAEGNILLPRSELAIKFERSIAEVGSNDDPVFLWKHGIQTQHGEYRAEENIIRHAHVRKMAATADALTCTSQALADAVGKRWNKRVFVFPNSLLFDDFHRFDIRRPESDVRVLWQGGYSHFPDFYPLRAAFKQAALRLPQVKWVVFGSLFNWVYDCISPFRVEFHPWVQFPLFHMKLGTLMADINIAPLADNRFNAGKSAIKFYEAAALSIPTLAQRSGPYAEEIIDGETGLLFSTPDEFAEKLAHLVGDKAYRVKLGEKANEWVHEYRDAMKTVLPLVEFYTRLVEEVRVERAAA